MKYKMIVADYDDTILNDDMTYSKRLKETIKRYVEIGGKFMIATGRMTSAVIDACRDLDLLGELITYQGSIISDIASGNIIESKPIDYKIAITAFKYLQERDIYHQLYMDEQVVVEKRTNESEFYSQFVNCKIRELGKPLFQFIQESKHNPIKGLVIDRSDNICELIEELSEKFGDELIINTSKKWLIELINGKSGKGQAVEKVASWHGIRREEVICIGDSLNDLSMIEYAGLGICVGNGVEQAKKVAKFIAPSNNDDGVTYCIERFGIED
ncbi:MAG: Cof-type HAD-IIB family hydrolase [Christensenellaceae bacterium]|jgi:Cof subfamily protein (haloacid dehalogenase superfamily)|nr:Cof-type HAD-IIB family hydrolase [Christensenellaceae bacterium]